ncbi:MAG: sugar phosphate isomerase/epimerase family protein [Rubripirellula sp.]
MRIQRRSALILSAASFAATLAPTSEGGEAGDSSAASRSSLGLCQYCARFARSAARERDASVDLFQPDRFFEHARQLGAGGYQVDFGILDDVEARQLRERAEEAGMYSEGIVRAPKTKSDLDRFAAEMKTAAAVGARAVRSTIFSGRRYEFFQTLDEYKRHDTQARRSLELAAPIAERFQVAFAPENHKDHRIEERVQALKAINSPFVGACVDTGNNFALLEDPVETAKALAPWAHSVHLKDQAVQLTESGFLFGDIPLGQGFIDLQQVVDVLRLARPKVHFTLELLTRDPLTVPCLEEAYWRTFPSLPAKDLARTLRTVRDHQAEELQYPSRLSLPEQVALEASNVRQSLDYARDVLGLHA